jgi:cytidylate kinase
MSEKSGFVIAIDGPVASGKGTIASKLAKELSGFDLYTGAMYRCIALLCIEKNINLDDEKEVESVLKNADIEFKEARIFLNGQDVTERIKEADTASGASIVGVYPEVRKVLVAKQQEIAQKVIEKGQIVVAEGRDMGTTVFSNASLRIYLTARPEVRAKRRMEQFIKEDKDLSEELEELRRRDKRDTERATSPLPGNPEELGYFVLDNSDMNEQETLNEILAELRRRKLIN